MEKFSNVVKPSEHMESTSWFYNKELLPKPFPLEIFKETNKHYLTNSS